MVVDIPIDLIINANTGHLITGTIAGAPVRVSGSLPASDTSLNGTFDESNLTARLSTTDQVPDSSGYVTTTNLAGQLGDSSGSLKGVFNLDSGFRFQTGAISGSINGRGISGAVSATATPNLTFNNIGYAADISGSFAGVAFDITANLPNNAGFVRGTIGGRSFQLRVAPTGQSGNFPPTRVTGKYSGPPALLAIIIGTVAFFAP